MDGGHRTRTVGLSGMPPDQMGTTAATKQQQQQKEEQEQQQQGEEEWKEEGFLSYPRMVPELRYLYLVGAVGYLV